MLSHNIYYNKKKASILKKKLLNTMPFKFNNIKFNRSEDL